MTPRRTHRGASGPPGGGRRRGTRKIRKAGGQKSGVCSFALPSAVAATLVALAQMAAVSWQSRMGGTR